MYKVVAFALTLCLLQDTNACCCFREPYLSCSPCCDPEVISCDVITYRPCAAPVCVAAAPCYETYISPCSPNVYVPTPCCRNVKPKLYGCVDACSYKPCLTPPPDCGFVAPLPCCRDTVYSICDTNPTSVRSCLPRLDSCDSRCCDEKPCIYFPEVEYPVLACDIEPFYYNTCWCA